MGKEEEIKIEDTNMAGAGGAEDKALRKRAAQTEMAWEDAGQKPGIIVWRIEKFKVKAWPKEQYGQFHKGDSYIVLQTIETRRAMEFHIYFWLGNESSIDEQATAAYKTVELDAFLDGRPTQSREVQEQESEQFHRVFPTITYLEGGIESGLRVTLNNHDLYDSKLYQIRKTKKGVQKKQVPLSRDSLNEGDCFVLDAGRSIYIWHGREAHPLEKYEANAEASRLETKRGEFCHATMNLDKRFWHLLGGEGPIKPANEGSDEMPSMERGEGVLYRWSDENGELEMTEVGRGKLSRSMLDTNDVMILDHIDEVCIWVGKGCTLAEKETALKTAKDFLKMNGRSIQTTPIHMYKEGQTIKNKLWNSIFAK